MTNVIIMATNGKSGVVSDIMPGDPDFLSLAHRSRPKAAPPTLRTALLGNSAPTRYEFSAAVLAQDTSAFPINPARRPISFLLC